MELSQSSDISKITKIPAAPGFLLKMYEILENPGLDHIVSWTDGGKALAIKNGTEFAQNILPKFFKHGNLSSLIRQLNLYNFKKIKNKAYEYVFRHDQFQHGKKDLLVNIKRKTPDLAAILSKNKIDMDNSDCNDSEFLYKENILLKKVQKDLMTKMKDLEFQLGVLNKKNQELTSQMQKVQNSPAVGSEATKGLQPQIKSTYITPQLPNEIQRVQTLTQNSISIQQGIRPTQPLAQNHQMIATTQIPGSNFVQSYQQIQLVPQERMIPIIIKPQQFHSNVFPMVATQDGPKRQFAFGIQEKGFTNNVQQIIVLPNDTTRTINSSFQFNGNGLFAHRPMQIYGGKDLESYENKSEDIHMIRIPNAMVKN